MKIDTHGDVASVYFRKAVYDEFDGKGVARGNLLRLLLLYYLLLILASIF